jgi:hypothetical protein
VEVRIIAATLEVRFFPIPEDGLVLEEAGRSVYPDHEDRLNDPGAGQRKSTQRLGIFTRNPILVDFFAQTKPSTY